jgi:hypothetical protein
MIDAVMQSASKGKVAHSCWIGSSHSCMQVGVHFI